MTQQEIQAVLNDHGVIATPDLLDDIADIGERRARGLLEQAWARLDGEAYQARRQAAERWKPGHEQRAASLRAAAFQSAAATVREVIDQTTRSADQ